MTTPSIWMKRRKNIVWFDWYYIAQDTRCDTLNGGRNSVLHLDLCHILEKVVPEARKQTKNQKRLSAIWGKNKRNCGFSYFTVLNISFWELCLWYAEINVEAVKWNVVCGILSCWPPVTKDATNAAEPIETKQEI